MFSPIFEKHIFEIVNFSKSENQLFDDHFLKKNVIFAKSPKINFLKLIWIKKSLLSQIDDFFVLMSKNQSAEIMFSPIFEKNIFWIVYFSNSENEIFFFFIYHQKVSFRKSMIFLLLMSENQCWNHVFTDFWKTDFWGRKNFQSENQLFDDHFTQ